MVKECRAIRPRFAADDSDAVRGEKTTAKKYIRTAVNRSSLDRLELRLAQIGWSGTQYVLTFDDEHLPKNYAGVQKALAAFVKAAKRWRARCGKPPDFDWIAVIEGQHGDHRYHIHFICDYCELCPAEVQHLWRCGIVPQDKDGLLGKPVLMDKQGFRRLALYFHKERRDGYVIPVGKHPFSCSRSLNQKIPPPKRWESSSGVVRAPKGAICLSTPSGAAATFNNGWGAFEKLSWIVPDGTPECRRAMRRMGYGGLIDGKAENDEDGVFDLPGVPAEDDAADRAGDGCGAPSAVVREM